MGLVVDAVLACRCSTVSASKQCAVELAPVLQREVQIQAAWHQRLLKHGHPCIAGPCADRTCRGVLA